MVRWQNYELKGQTGETASAQAAQCFENLTGLIIPARLQTYKFMRHLKTTTVASPHVISAAQFKNTADSQ